jgi:hypothetical protein
MNTAVNRTVSFALFSAETSSKGAKKSRQLFIKCAARFGGEVSEGWEYGNVGGEVKNKRMALKEHHVNGTKETGKRGIHKIN